MPSSRGMPLARCAVIAGLGTLQNDYIDETVECLEVVAVAGVRRKAGGEGGCCDEQVDGSGTAVAPGGADRGEDPTVGPGGIGVEGEGIESGLGPLQPILAARALLWIGGRVGTGGELG